MKTKNDTFDKVQQHAQKLISNRKKILGFIQDAYGKAVRNKEKLKGAFQELKTFIQLLSSWAKGEYNEAPLSSIIAVMAAILYFLNPIDLLPDFLAVLGLVDDVFVITQVWAMVKKDVEKFNRWKEQTYVLQ